MRPRGPAPLRVYVITPLGRGGHGGIDRMMDAVRDRLEERGGDDVACRFIASRGRAGAALSPIRVAHVLAALAAARLSRRCDVAHINLSSHGSARRKMIIAAAARRLGIPYLLHLHGSEFRSYWDHANAATSRGIATMFSRAARVVVLGRVWRDYVAARAPECAARITILPNATRTPRSRERAPEDEPVIAFLGRLGARKGVPQLIEALSRLPRDRAWRAILAGDGAVEATRREIARRGLASRVAVPGWLGAAEVGALLAKADILALPSFDENLPMSVVEAMAHGLAVVTTPVGATPDIIADGATGLLVAPGDADALARALALLLESPDTRARLGAAARAFHRENLEIAGYVERLVALWGDAAARRRAP